MAKPFVLMSVALAVIAGLLSFKGMVVDRRHDMLLAQQSVRQATVQAEEQLQNKVQIAANNSIFLKNLDWGLAHSVNQTLAGLLEPGVLDELHLHDANCQVMAQAVQGALSGLDCPLRVVPDNQWNHAYWFASRTQANIALTRTVNVGTQGVFYLTAVVKLTAPWLRNRTGIGNAIDRLELRLIPGTQQEGAVVVDRLTLRGSKRQGALLVSDDRLAQWFPQLLQPGGIRLDAYIWIATILTLSALLYAWWRTAGILANIHRQRQQLLDWSRSVLRQGASENQTATCAIVDEELAKALVGVAKAIGEKQQTIMSLQNDSARLAAELKDRDEELGEYQRQLSDLAELESFALQIRGMSSRFMDRLSNLAQGLEKTVSTLGGGLGIQARNLRAQMNSWRQQIEERSARRFMRALAEATTADGRSELDVQLELITNACSHIQKESERLLVQADHMKENLHRALAIAAHWHGLALRESDGPEARSVLECALAAQDLYRSNDQAESLQFVNVLGLVYQGRLPKVPQVVLTSAIYHLCEAVANYLSERAIKDHMVRTQIIDHHERSFVLIGTDDPISFDPSVDALCQEDYHFRMSRQLLTNFGMFVQPLCAAPGHVLFGISWVRRTGEAVESGSWYDERTAHERSQHTLS